MFYVHLEEYVFCCFWIACSSMYVDIRVYVCVCLLDLPKYVYHLALFFTNPGAVRDSGIIMLLGPFEIWNGPPTPDLSWVFL